MKKIRLIAVPTLLCLSVLITTPVYGDDDNNENDKKVRHVIVISIDGMHALDLALWVKSNPGSALAKLAGQGMNYTNASTSRPSDSIPATAGIFTGGTPAVTGMYYDDAYHRGWYPATNATCAGAPGPLFSFKHTINPTQPPP